MLLFLFKMVRIVKAKAISVKVEDYFASNTLALTFVVLKCVLIIMFIAHWMACLVYYLGYEESFLFADAMLASSEILDMDLVEKYVTCLYFSLSTMTTVGFGDMVPKTKSEEMLTVFVMLCACATFGFTVGTLGGAI